jgi:hypothetical protein
VAKKDTPIRHSQFTVFLHCKTAVHANHVALQFEDGDWKYKCKKGSPSKAKPVRWLTISLMEVVIEPTDVLRIIYAIFQVRRSIPL